MFPTPVPPDALRSPQQIDSKTMKKMFSLMSDTLPIRLRGIYVLHQPWYINVIWALVRPFMVRVCERV